MKAVQCFHQTVQLELAVRELLKLAVTLDKTVQEQ